MSNDFGIGQTSGVIQNLKSYISYHLCNYRSPAEENVTRIACRVALYKHIFLVPVLTREQTGLFRQRELCISHRQMKKKFTAGKKIVGKFYRQEKNPENNF